MGQPNIKHPLGLLALMVLLICLSATSTVAAEKLRVGALRLTSSAPLFIAVEKGYFAHEGLDVELKFMKSAQPVAMALAAGDVDVGATGLTAGLYNAAANGLKVSIVADKGRVWPGYRLVGLMVSNDAWEKGVRSLSDLEGKRVGITQVGSTFHYMLGNILSKNGMDLKDVKPTPLGGVKSMMDAVAADRIDTAFMVQPFCTVMEKKKLGRVMLWAGDEMRYQIAAIFISEKMKKNESLSLKFMRAYIRACRFYYDNCLTKKDGALVKGPGFDEVIGYIAKYTSRKPSLIALGFNYNDRDGKLFAEDIQRQIDWYHDHKMVGKRLDAKGIVNMELWRKAVRSLDGK
ncbi:MAG: ABC transporter substrate-binding protein [Deltaproteobacteria bacterium]|nr:ABC transporter substrate-binding protein [Deltaproteobacteria bacterium]